MNINISSINAQIIVACLLIFCMIWIATFWKFRILQHRYKSLRLRTMEETAAKISSDLHDEVGAYLSIAKLLLDDLKEKLGNEDIQTAIGHIGTAIKRIREIPKGMLPEIFFTKGLVAALNTYCESIPDSIISIGFNHSNIPNIDIRTASSLYKIVLEIVNNCIKHSGATKLIINLYYSFEQIVLETRDNGIGYRAEDFLKSGSGDIGIRNRVKDLNGKILIESNNGTRFFISIPFESI
jgi:two-component system NarL family sensor kinase